MRIYIQYLRKIIDTVLSRVLEEGTEYVDLPMDYYWNIPSRQMYVLTEPKDFDMGQLTDDWPSLQRTVEENTDIVARDIVFSSSVLRAVGDLLSIAELPYGWPVTKQDKPLDTMTDKNANST